ncbi:MAG TPA: methyltransferase domain-containing protein [Stellaceae bacterium]|jgi:predicted SAM-dependent methyltransferase|nr:methyltransferase domain-containing protein [Stellaceae bacterium]
MKKLHIGCGNHPLPGWTNTDLNPWRPDILRMDATQHFPFADGEFDYAFSEHMIEHVPHAGGLTMLAECHRVMKPGGRIRISCPDRAFIQRLCGPAEQLTDTDWRYVAWAKQHFGMKTALDVGVNLANGFGHQFIYSVSLLHRALVGAGFASITQHLIGQSSDPELRDLENDGRMPPGFLQLETMTLEGVVA